MPWTIKRTFLFFHVSGKTNTERSKTTAQGGVYKKKYTEEFHIYFISFFSTNEHELQTT